MKSCRLFAPVAVLLLLLLSCSLALADIVPIPMDREVMDPINDSYYVSDREYEDPSIHVTIEEGEYLDTPYLVARIRIADPSQLRAYCTGKSLATGLEYADKISKQINAVFALSGDALSMKETDWSTKKGKFVMRMGKLWYPAADKVESMRWKETYDYLIIDEHSDLHVIENATKDTVLGFEGEIVSTYVFGPALVVDGKKMEGLGSRKGYGVNYGAKKKTQRICFGQTGPLEYICVVCAGPEQRRLDGKTKSRGLTIEEFTDLVYSQGDVQVAYNLDGGASSHMVFQNQWINAYGKTAKNALGDVIYFASAWQE
ncbi:MAG: phosphodiester glycosidase family protein [Clostridia bacterium]|nr:phosphodiester glycosidase family protein [Clostridia bacterium]